MDGLQAAHIDHHPEDVGLPHEKGEGSQKDGPDAVNKPAASFSGDPLQVVLVQNKHHHSRKDIGVVERREEEKGWEESDVGSNMLCVERWCPR